MNDIFITDYSIVSRGTEQYNNHGYIAITKPINSFRYLQNIDHNVLESKIDKDSVKIYEDYSIENIAVSRFQLIFELMYSRTEQYYNGEILITGFGNIGLGVLIGLLDKGYKKISILVKEEKPYMTKAITTINSNYNTNIKLFTYNTISIGDYNSYIECSGSSEAIKHIFSTCTSLSNIFIISTPKEQEYLIDPLLINRKNLKIFGGHEFNGIDKKQREIIFNQILKSNDKKTFLTNFISIYPYSENKLEEIKKSKNDLIEILKYEV